MVCMQEMCHVKGKGKKNVIKIISEKLFDAKK